MNRRGFTLIEMIVYIAALTVILTVAYPAFHKALRGSRDLQRNADDIMRAIHAGEHWRKDVRAATGPVRADGDTLFIPQRSGNVVYRFSDGAVWRETGAGRNRFLRDVKASGMRPDRRAQVTVWRWEVELTSARKDPAVRPLFTFEATP